MLYTENMKRTVIGLVGPISSGKSYVGKYLQNHLGFVYESLSQRVREEADRLGIPRERESLQDVGNGLREIHGVAVLAEMTVELLSGVEGNIVIDGLRNPGEIMFLKQVYDIEVLAINAPVELRLQWYLARSEERGEEAGSEERFWISNNRDLGIGEPADGQQVAACMDMADYMLQNDGSKKRLCESLEYYLIRELGLSPEGLRRSQERK